MPNMRSHTSPHAANKIGTPKHSAVVVPKAAAAVGAQLNSANRGTAP